MSLIVGLGSPNGDDQLGWAAIDRLRPLLPAGTRALKVRDGLELLESLEGHDTAIVIDAAAPAGRPGTIRSFEWPCPQLSRCALASTHGLGLVAGLQLAQALKLVPHYVKIYTIEGHETSPGKPLSSDVARQLDSLVECVLADLGLIHRAG